MTVAIDSNKVVYAGNGITTVFPFSFRVDNVTYLQVYTRVVATGVLTLLTQGVDYTVAGVPGAGSVTYNPAGVPIPATLQLLILRLVPVLQGLDINNQGGFYPDTLEAQLDLMTMVDQQQEEQLGRTVMSPYGQPGYVMPVPLSGALLGWNVGANALENKAGTGGLSAPDLRDFADVAPYVATRTLLKALDTTKDQVAWLTEVSRWGQFVWRLGDYSALVALDTQGGYVLKADAIAATVGAWVRVTTELSPKMFGAVGDDATNDDTAVDVWFAVLMATTLDGLVDGRFRVSTHKTWDFSTRRIVGVKIKGLGPNDTYFNVADTTTSPAMYWHSNSLALFFCTFRDFGVRTNRAGVGFQIGQDDFVDAWNQCVFDNIVIANGAASALNVSLRLNQVLGSYMNMTANAGGSGKPGQPGAPGYGTSTEFRQVVGCHGAIHGGNSVIGHKYTVGFSYGNTWGATNIEEVTNAIFVDSASCVHNTYDGGYFVVSTMFNATAGTDNSIRNPNISFYAGGVLGANLTGWSIISGVAGSVLTRSNATGFGIYRGGATIDPTAHLHQYDSAGTVTHRIQSGASTFDISMTASGAFITNTVTDGPLNYTTTGANSYHAWPVNAVEIARLSASGLALVGVLTPKTNDGAALGTTALQWSDLFLATGGVLNFANGNYTVTHTSALLTFSGAILSANSLKSNSPTAGIGYATGAGGTVTQATSKTTGVTLNTITGQITMNAAALASGAVVSFNAANSAVAANDLVVVNHISGGSLGSYTINARTSAGQITFDVKNTFTGSLSEAIVIAYAVIKAVIA